jgi:hypothetical protein
MDRAGYAGSNTYYLSLTCYIQLVRPIPKEGQASDPPKLVRNSRWYFDIKSGHFALEQPPKLSIYKFTKADFATLKKKLKLNVEQAGADQPATKPADKVPAKIQPSTPTPKDLPR